jgi:hypothetical protein
MSAEYWPVRTAAATFDTLAVRSGAALALARLNSSLALETFTVSVVPALAAVPREVSGTPLAAPAPVGASVSILVLVIFIGFRGLWLLALTDCYRTIRQKLEIRGRWPVVNLHEQFHFSLGDLQIGGDFGRGTAFAMKP